MPGLTDAHVHICAVDVNIPEQHRLYPPSLLAAKALRILADTLQQGSTTVRDAGGADAGFRVAVERGIMAGPRLLVVRGNPLQDLTLLQEYRHNILMIMKEGRIYKDLLG
jgi:cytosine/adenosine deaminase-related metal-dependent hydrolase